MRKFVFVTMIAFSLNLWASPHIIEESDKEQSTAINKGIPELTSESEAYSAIIHREKDSPYLQGSCGDQILWHQPISTTNSTAYANQDFESGNNTYDTWNADDFTNTVPWSISTIYMPTSHWNNGDPDLTCATSINFYIYADNLGIPAGYPDGGLGGSGTPVWSISLPPTDSQITLTDGTNGDKTNVTLSLNSPIQLPAGTYWLVFYPEMNLSTCGQSGVHVSDTNNGYLAKLINPGDGWGTGATIWTDMNVVHSIDKTDLAFSLMGSTKGSNSFLPSIYYLLQ